MDQQKQFQQSKLSFSWDIPNVCIYDIHQILLSQKHLFHIHSIIRIKQMIDSIIKLSQLSSDTPPIQIPNDPSSTYDNIALKELESEITHYLKTIHPSLSYEGTQYLIELSKWLNFILTELKLLKRLISSSRKKLTSDLDATDRISIWTSNNDWFTQEIKGISNN